MISIFSHLYQKNGKQRTDLESGLAEALGRLSLGLLENISRNVLVGESLKPLRQELEEVKNSLLQTTSTEQVLQAERAVSQILAGYRASTQEVAVAQAVEIQHIFAMLNQALIVVSDGRDRSVSRLSEIQKTLQRTSMIQDIVAMKSALAETVNFVEREVTEARKVVSEELARLQTEVGNAREFIANTRTELAGRSEGIARIQESVQQLNDGQALYTLVYVCDRLHAITQRYGPQVTEELVFRVIRERLQPVAPVGGVFRWTSSGLVGIFARPRDLPALSAEVAALNRAPVIHKVALGNRTATLTMSPSSLVLEGTAENTAPMLEQLDKFTGAVS